MQIRFKDAQGDKQCVRVLEYKCKFRDCLSIDVIMINYNFTKICRGYLYDNCPRPLLEVNKKKILCCKNMDRICVSRKPSQNGIKKITAKNVCSNCYTEWRVKDLNIYKKYFANELAEIQRIHDELGKFSPIASSGPQKKVYLPDGSLFDRSNPDAQKIMDKINDIARGNVEVPNVIDDNLPDDDVIDDAINNGAINILNSISDDGIPNDDDVKNNSSDDPMPDGDVPDGNYRDKTHPYNSEKYHTGKECAAAKCHNPAGTAWSPYWCVDCNIQRMDEIASEMAEINQDFDPGMLNNCEPLPEEDNDDGYIWD